MSAAICGESESPDVAFAHPGYACCGYESRRSPGKTSSADVPEHILLREAQLDATFAALFATNFDV
jgi:hypothetical protein